MENKTTTLGAAGSKKQTRLQNLVEERFDSIILEKLNPRLDNIEAFCRERLTAMDKRSKDIQSFILGEVKVKVNDQLYNADITVKAVEKALVKMFTDAGLPFDSEVFSKLIDTFKVEINESTKKRAAEELQTRIDGLIAQAQADDAAKAVAPPAVEASGAETPVPAQG